MFAGLFGINGIGPMDVRVHLALYPTTMTALAIGVALALLPRSNGTPPRQNAVARWWRHRSAPDFIFMTALIVFSALSISSGTYSPFLYFRF